MLSKGVLYAFVSIHLMGILSPNCKKLIKRFEKVYYSNIPVLKVTESTFGVDPVGFHPVGQLARFKRIVEDPQLYHNDASVAQVFLEKNSNRVAFRPIRVAFRLHRCKTPN